MENMLSGDMVLKVKEGVISVSGVNSSTKEDCCLKMLWWQFISLLPQL